MPTIWPKYLLALAQDPQLMDKVWGLPMEPATLRDCQNCGGLGVMYAFVIANTHPEGGPTHMKWINDRWHVGYTVGQPCPVCASTSSNERGAWLEAASGLEGVEFSKTLDTFRPLPGKEAALAAAREIASDIPAPAGWATFYGSFGRGKTHLLMGIVNAFIAAGVHARYVASMGDLLAEVQEEFGKPGAAEMLVNRYKHTRVLVIDEVEKFNPSEWALGVVFRLMNDRYRSNLSVLTVLGTNLDPYSPPPHMGYLASRMKEGRLIEVSGDDVRPGKAPQ